MTLILFQLNVNGQSSTLTSGGEAISNDGSVSYSIGQVTYETTINFEGSVFQGVQQAYEIMVISNTQDKELNAEMNVYPNPTSDVLHLTVDEDASHSSKYQLYDSKGTLLQSESLSGAETTIDIHSYQSATYFVNVMSETQVVKIFKIVKN